MRLRSFFLASCVLGPCITGCQPEQPRRAEPQIEDSFSLGSGPFAGTRQGHVTLRREALGKAFMVLPTIISGSSTPMPVLVAPRVVSFEMQGAKLGMLERNLNAVYSELPSETLLQTFVVTGANDETVTFDWHMGLESVNSDTSFWPSEWPGALERAGQRQPASQVRDSFLRSARIVDNGLELDQVSRLQTPEGADQKGHRADAEEGDRVTVRTRIVPYVENEQFEPRLGTRQRGVGYFEVAHRRPNQTLPDLLATRWDAHPGLQPITYRISRHAPRELVQSIAEGVLYWNRVAGRELVRVQTNADPDATLGYRQVMIHWITWGHAGAAYANFQADPVTGETLRGIIYLPSAFVDRAHGAMGARAHALNLAASGFASGVACAMVPEAPAPWLAAPLARDTLLSTRAAADVLRLTVAHEVGHTLGLRHNFAASQDSVLRSVSHRSREMADYLAQPGHPGARTAASVMDYFGSEEELLLGAAIRHQVLPYDEAALQWGYSEVPVRMGDLGAHAFCTDYTAREERMLGCGVRDSGAQPLRNYADAVRWERQQLGEVVARELPQILAAANRPGAQHAALAPNAAQIDVGGLAKAFDHLAEGAGVLAVERRLETGGFLNTASYVQATRDALAGAARGAGGLPGLLDAGYPLDAQGSPVTGWLLRDVRAGLQRQGLSPAQVEAHCDAFGPRATAVEQQLLEIALKSLTGALKPAVSLPKPQEAAADAKKRPPETFAAGVVDPDWEPRLTATGRAILLDLVPTDTHGALPTPRFSRAVRLAAVRLYSEALFGVPGWAQAEREQLVADLAARRATEAHRPLTGSPAARAQWLETEYDILDALTALNPPNAPTLMAE